MSSGLPNLPDGTKIAFASSRDGNSEIYVMDEDGGNQINLTHNAASDSKPAWSPSGTIGSLSKGKATGTMGDNKKFPLIDIGL